ncbi:MAG: polysaccharide pyruvyl transferase CsaB [bacterium]
MKRLLLVGYFGFDNLGDELLLISLLDYLKKNLPDVKPLVLYSKILPEVYGAEVVPRRKLISGIKRADGVCFAGGSILQDVTSLRSLLYYLGIILLSFIMGKQVIMISQGIGPIRSSLGKRLLKILNLVYSISVRDVNSFKLLDTFGICRPKRYLGNDLVLFLDLEVLKNISSIDKKRDILIAVREFAGFKEEEFLKALIRFRDKYGINMAILVTHKLEDRYISERFAKRLNCDLIFWEDPISILPTILSSRFVISMRLHPLILSALLGIPFLGIKYDPKVAAFISLFPNVYSLDVNSPTEKIEKVLSLSWENRDKTVSSLLSFKNTALNRDGTFQPLCDIYDLWFKDK